MHVGDITSGRGPCTDEWMQARKRPVRDASAIRSCCCRAITTGPIATARATRRRSGWRHWRELFCTREPRLKLEVQRGEYCEHVRWQAGNPLFVALNVQGSNNNLGRNAAMDAEHLARMKAVLAWIDDSERAFRARRLKHIVLAMQANPFLKPRSGENGFSALLERMKKLVADNPGAVILVNGDSHTYRDDQPLPGLRRIESGARRS